MKDPFYFSKNQIPIQLNDVDFRQIKLSDGFSIGYMEGSLPIEGLHDLIPNVDSDFGFSATFTEILFNVQNGTEGEIRWLAALQNLSVLYRYGAIFLKSSTGDTVISIPPSIESHYQLEKKIAEQEPSEETSFTIAQAAYAMFLMSREGVGGEPNSKAAENYLLKAANLGHAEANYATGVLLYQNGSAEKAHQMFEVAARLGNLDAQINCAVNYFNGKMVNKDLEKAYFWALIASQRDKEGVQLSEAIRPLLEKTQITKIESAAEQEHLRLFALLGSHSPGKPWDRRTES